MKNYRLLTVLFIALLMSVSSIVMAQQHVYTSATPEGEVKITVVESSFQVSIVPEGNIVDFAILTNGSVSYDFKGRVDQVGNVSISYDVKGRIDDIDSESFMYDIKGRLTQIGSTSIQYDAKGKIDQIGDVRISYDVRGNIDEIE
ncbi:hypothetical protein [Plebeiibacterium sediminum]|uniref:YD repeat-containing protein n=1 Tax=Plebeiibacterium sediminum TaxID=2992112 RepID=A0AAE3M8Q8_9BACT|nr:hypothetical protein [Plebeiobacterium sediminum]MCW3788900.1 hypothetical protein [Plebeiobacterium sediminum]